MEIEFDMQRAMRAYQWNSQVPGERAKQQASAFRGRIETVRAEMEKLASSDEQRAILEYEMGQYIDGLRQRTYAVLDARSRTASAMVTGASNFPTARNRKALNTEMKRVDELEAWHERTCKAIRLKVRAASTVDEREDAEYRRLHREMIGALAVVQKIDEGDPDLRGFNRRSFVTSTVGMIRRSSENGYTRAAKRVLVDVIYEQEHWRHPFITPRNSIWKLLEETVETEPTAEPEKTGVELIEDVPGLMRAERNYDIGRLQIFILIGRNQPMYVALKKRGWHWSPTNGCWQRQITNAAEAALQLFLDTFRTYVPNG